MPPRPSRSRPALAAGTAVLLAVAAGGCGSGDDDPSAATTSAGGGTTTATTGATGTGRTTTSGGTTSTGGTTTAAGGRSAGGSGAPAADEGAIRAALARSAASSKAAGTARITLETSTAGIATKATGTIDLADQRYALTQTLGDDSGSAGAKTTFENYGEKGKVYIRIPGAGGWRVTDNPIQATDPLAQVKQLAKATITDIGGTKEYGGRTCREFRAELGLADVLGAIDDPSFKRFLDAAPKGAKVPVTTCIDDAGLAYSSTSSYDLQKVLGSAAAQLPGGRSVSKLLVTGYGTAPAPKRPAGIDDATPLGAGTAAPSAG